MCSIGTYIILDDGIIKNVITFLWLNYFNLLIPVVVT
jgi:hypothetical protein